ncbi:class C sortase [Actinomyces trachealis]|uniref:class C sortase n=1 Tax=Actinomyces trachealis TaxID=2763540 RepID=UPI002467F5D8|nr:class C sortase [Actinomyces trachealis]
MELTARQATTLAEAPPKPATQPLNWLPVTDAAGRRILVAPERATQERKWRLSWLAVTTAVLAVTGMLLFSYPTAAAWVSQYNQSKIVTNYESQVALAKPAAAEQLTRAHEYNQALSVGAVLEANHNVPTGDGTSSDQTLNYAKMLDANGAGLMARLRINKIDLDLPIYHGTSEETLLTGLGHLEGTSLPVGGASTRTVVTGHRGLANATMFTNLDKVEVGDTFTFEVFGDVITYRVFDKKVVDPEETESLRAVEGKDLATLVTCTPLGINTHRILVTGERITPTPAKDVEAKGKAPDIPGFPWWIVLDLTGITVVGLYVWRAGYPPKLRRRRRP